MYRIIHVPLTFIADDCLECTPLTRSLDRRVVRDMHKAFQTYDVLAAAPDAAVYRVHNRPSYHTDSELRVRYPVTRLWCSTPEWIHIPCTLLQEYLDADTVVPWNRAAVAAHVNTTLLQEHMKYETRNMS